MSSLPDEVRGTGPGRLGCCGVDWSGIVDAAHPRFEREHRAAILETEKPWEWRSADPPRSGKRWERGIAHVTRPAPRDFRPAPARGRHAAVDPGKDPGEVD